MDVMPTIVPGFGDTLPKLLLVNSRGAQTRLLHALYLAGVASRDAHHLGDDQKLFGARVVADPAAEWEDLRPWVRAVVAFGPDSWAATLEMLAVDDPGFAHGASVVADGDRPVTALACLDLDDEALPEAALAEILASAQHAAGLSWGCGGRARG